MAAIALVNVAKRYGPIRAVSRLNLEVRDGEFFVILGPAGAGKTSTLKMIAGIEDITEGEIFVGGVPVRPQASDEIDMAMIFETYALYPHFTVFENMAFPLRARGRKLGAAEIASRIGDVARSLEIEGLLGRYPAELSGGQKQRVSLGRALVRRPRAFLMDEPLSHLDAKLRHQMRRELKRLKTKLGTTVIFVTHDYLEALSLADRIAVLDKGELRQVGTPDEIYLAPEDAFIASLFGHPKINLVEGVIRERDGRPVFSAPDGEIVLPLPPALGRMRDRAAAVKITAGIRPAAIRIAGAPSPGSFRVASFLSEDSGNKRLYHMRIGGTTLTGIMGSGGTGGEPEELFVSIDAESVLYFGPSGKRIREGGHG